MTYGDGDGYEYYPFTSRDIVAHEITHGLTENTAGLYYQYESGALNESFSDIFGIAVDFYTDPDNANYLMAEQVTIDGNGIRSMSDPNSHGHPDTYMGDYWYYGSGDNGGVHMNSGVQNYWFYLLCEGGSGQNDSANYYNVNAIGIDKAAAIAYRNLTVYLGPNSDYEDARFYSIQSAIDLYGSCSDEVIQVTNAWYAVGVGTPFNDAVIAGFNVSQTHSCSYPVTIQLFNKSTNASEFSWYVNDELFSNDPSPALQLDTVGNYSVKLIVTGTATCSSSDSLERDNLIEVTNQGEPVSAACIPSEHDSVSSYGIYKFILGTINNVNNDIQDGYDDFCCEYSTSLTAGRYYPIEMEVDNYYNKNISIWLDANANGIFSTNELIYSSQNKSGDFLDSIFIPQVTYYDSLLRLRVGVDNMYNAVLNGCNSSSTSQYQDYSVSIEPNNSKPGVNFKAKDITVKSGTSVQFNDLSTSFPTSWHWTFEGATPSSATSQNPVVTYNATGSYDVQLVATNEFGSDTLFIPDYISVTNTYIMGQDNNSNTESGILLDSGGEDGYYKNNENYSFLIEPPCADTVLLSFSSFRTEGGFDYLTVYDGENSSGIKLLSTSGSTLPNSVTAISGKMYITFHSDGSATYPGFKATWTSNHIQSGSLPVANFHSDYNEVPFSWNIQLIDSSLNDPYKWMWTFDNQEISFKQNAAHKFSESGTSPVKLNVENCAGKDSITKDLNIQLPPELIMSEDTVKMHLFTGQKDTNYVVLDNARGQGDLMYKASLSLDDQMTNMDSTQFLRGRNVLMYISYNNYFSDDLIQSGANVYNLNSYWERTLDTIDLLILDHHSSLSSAATDSVINWLNRGGTLIISDYYYDTPYNTILNTAGISYNNDYCYSGYASSIVPGILTENISQYYESHSSNIGLTVTNNAFPVIYSSNGILNVAASNTPTSKILAMVGYPFYSSYYYDTGHQQLIRNFLQWSLGRKWVTVEPDEGTVAVNASDSLSMKFNASYLYGGDYTTQLLVQTNDTSGTEIRIPIKLTVTGVPKIQLDKNHIDYGKIFYGHSDQMMQQLNISNTGTDNLIIDTVYTSDAVFSSNTTEINISPEHECTLNIYDS